MDSDDTLLDYDIYPDYFDVNSTKAALQILVSPWTSQSDESVDPWNPPATSHEVYLHKLTIEIPVGGGNADFTRHGEGIQFPKPIGWREVDKKWRFGPFNDWVITHEPRSGGRFVFKPPTPEKIDANSAIVISLTNIDVSGLGSTVVSVTEEAAYYPSVRECYPLTYRQKLHRTSKFHVGQLWADKNYYYKDGQVMLSWSGSEGAEYSLHWRQNGEKHVKHNLPHSSALMKDNGFLVDDLRDDSVTFALKTNPEPSEHFKNECTVWMLRPEPKFVKFEAYWEEDDKLILDWELENYSSAEIKMGPQDIDFHSSLTGKGKVEFWPSREDPLPSTFTLKGNNPHSGEWDTWTLETQFSRKPYRHANLGVRSRPWSVAFSDDGKHVLVPLLADDKITVLDVRTLAEHSNSPISVGITPKSIAVSPGSVSHLFVDDSNDYSVIVIDGDTFETIKKVAVSHEKYTGDPILLRMQPEGSNVFVLDGRYKKVSTIDANTLHVDPKAFYSLGFTPVSMAASKEKIFVIGRKEVTLTVIDTKTLKPTKGSPFDLASGASKIVVSPDGSQFSISFPWRKVVRVFNTDTCEELPNSPITFKGKPDGISYSPDGARIFVAALHSNIKVQGTISVLDSKTLKHVTGSPVNLGHRIQDIGASTNGVFMFAIDPQEGVLYSHQAEFTRSSKWGFGS